MTTFSTSTSTARVLAPNYADDADLEDLALRSVGDAVLDLVATRIVKDVSRPTSARISELVTPPALHLLTRSIAHAVVPTHRMVLGEAVIVIIN